MPWTQTRTHIQSEYMGLQFQKMSTPQHEAATVHNITFGAKKVLGVMKYLQNWITRDVIELEIKLDTLNKQDNRL